ncbi:non-ribosomal peptide synthetase [Ruminiclostridium cellobioparum]|uniref:non-ribosomal peptide synthetase n=1 Tax=Ruminiclostridium cellobioparum TaxID=29355 RepID=UPI00047F0FB0|nr:non-ribosomal peptide synthetase [Ruminiclostridium cellobioparum]
MIENDSCLKEKQPIEKFISELKAKSIKLWKEDGFLRYKAPKGVITAEILKDMAERKEEIKNYLISSDFGDAFSRPIPKIEMRDYYSLSAAQKRMYLVSQIDSESTAYNMTQVLKIEGDLDLNHFTQVIEKLVERHEILRTSFEFIEGKPVQKIHQKVSFNIEYNEMEEDKEKVDLMIGEFIRPYDLSKPPLFRFKLVKLKNASERPTYILLQDMHHIVGDGVSEGILVSEVNELYAGKDLPALNIQYKDYAVWQEKLLESEEVESQKRFWKELLSGELPVLNLPADFTRPIEFSYKGDSVLFALNRELAEKLYQLARENRVTLYIVLLTAYNILLAKYTGQTDIIIGTPSAGRRHSDIQNTLGVFINTLVLRNFPQADKTFSAFLQEVGANVLKVFDNQDYQFEQLVDELNIKRDLSRNPIFDTMFILQNMNIGDVKAEGLEISGYQYKRKMSQFDIETIAAESKKGIDIEINYCTDLFKRETIERFGRHFLNILNFIVDNTQVRLHEIDLLDNEEKDQVLNEFNNTAAEFPRDKTLHELFENQVEKTPLNTALIFNNKTLTYKELNEKSNQLANVLRSKGIKPDDIVGIMVERSFEMLIGIMGILKAGGAYLPIDTEYPEERINYILDDGGAKLVLTRKQLEHKLRFAGEIIDLEEESLYQGDYKNLEKINNPKDLAYVIYTSGSTGKPKGVMIEHGSAVNILIGLQEDYPLLEEDTYLLKTTYTFDVSVAELFGWFYAGGRLAILEPGEEKNPQKVLEAIEQYHVTHINFVPSMLNLFLDICAKEKTHTLDKLRYIFACGEALPKEVVNKFNKISSKVKLENIYGPTESTIYATRYSLSDSAYQDIVPIGQPLQNIQAYILDKNNNLQPIGVPGELCLGGKGIARGYINRPELTSSKFIPNPFRAGEKIYKTGDLVKWLPDGNIEYLGRMDHQVKIRGFRIELGEIESQLYKLEYIKEAVVVAREDAKSGTKYLCAYIVADRDLIVHEIRENLKTTLPEYMVPSYFIQMENLPLSQNGKIDRKALPAQDGKFSTGEEYVAPSNEIEQKLVEVWQEILGVKKVGIKDNFFDLGGNSLKAIQMMGRLEGYSLNMRHIMQYPTIAELQKYVVGLNAKEHELPLIMRQNIDMEYHFLKNGETDDYSIYLDCASLMLYFISKKKLKSIKGIRELFLGDIVPKVIQNSDGSIYDVDHLAYPFREDIFKVQYYRDKGYQSIKEIEELLDKGELVIVNTFMQRVPFSVHFRGAEYSALEVNDEHTFLIIAYDKQRFYYVEIPHVINAENYIPYDGNKSVGIIDKEELRPAFDVLLNFATVSVDEQKLNKGSQLKKLIQLTLDNYEKGVFYEEGRKVSQGFAAIPCLMELCEKCNLDLNNRKVFTGTTLVELFNWKIWMIASQRKLLKFVLEEYDEECNYEVRLNLMDRLEELCKMWIDLGHLIGGRHGKGEAIFDTFYMEYLRELKDKEEELINELKEMWSPTNLV